MKKNHAKKNYKKHEVVLYTRVYNTSALMISAQNTSKHQNINSTKSKLNQLQLSRKTTNAAEETKESNAKHKKKNIKKNEKVEKT